jgi:hypothetical protein
MTYNELIKQRTYKWRESHHEEYKKYIREKVNEHYHRNKDNILKKLKNTYQYKKEVLRLSFLELF